MDMQALKAQHCNRQQQQQQQQRQVYAAGGDRSPQKHQALG
jgi:hypothetical protein